jgi:hypothetical protein
MKSRVLHGRRGFALISTLLIITVLTVVVVAFMQSMQVERLTSRAFLNKTRADLAAESAVQEAIAKLRDGDLTFLVNAYLENSVTYKGTAYASPYLATLKLNASGTAVAETRFMASTPGLTLAPGDSPPSGAAVEYTDINAPSSSFPQGYIGLTDAFSQRRTIPVPWINILRNPSMPPQPSQTLPNYNPVVARYAYWTDDESAKINLSTAGAVITPSDPANPAAGNTAPQRLAGGSLSEVSVTSLLGADGAQAEGTKVDAFLKQRAAFPDGTGFSPVLFRDLGGAEELVTNWDNRRASVTALGKSDERGALGIRKLNLNDYVATAHDVTSPEGRAAIVSNVVALGDFINQALPDFGSRFYTGAVTVADKRIYCVKIAANIQDYIDTDSQPTVIRQNLASWENAPDPTVIGEGAPANPPAVFGKEVVPSMTEYMSYHYNESGRLRIDHTFEILNIYTKPIDFSDVTKLGHVKILMAERNDITPKSGSSAADPDVPGEPGGKPLSLDISLATAISPGGYVLLTTLPSDSAQRAKAVSSSPAPVWMELSNREPSTYSYGSSGLIMNCDYLADSADATTEIVIANEYGYLDIHARIPQQGPPGGPPLNLLSTTTSLVPAQSFGNKAAGSGNNTHRGYPLDSGDPRAELEVYPVYSEVGTFSSIAWRRSTVNNFGTTVLGNDSAGFFPENDDAVASYVPEPVIQAASTTRIAAVIRDGEMKTTGELGFIFDPAVSGAGYDSLNQTRNKGGFRTLAIGTRRGEVDGIGPTAAPTRLTQVVPDPSSPLTSSRAYRLLDLFTANKQQNGRILLNSVLRNPGNLPLRAVFENLKAQSNVTVDADGNGDLAGPKDPKLTAGVDVAVNSVIIALESTARSGGKGPFLSLGQISDLDLFNTGTTLLSGNDLTPTARNNDHSDRGREEILRNSFELLTLKGTVYTVYVVAQAGDMLGATFVPKATSRFIRTVELQRTYPQTNPLQDRTMPNLLTNNQPTAVTAKELYDERL